MQFRLGLYTLVISSCFVATSALAQFDLSNIQVFKVNHGLNFKIQSLATDGIVRGAPRALDAILQLPKSSVQVATFISEENERIVTREGKSFTCQTRYLSAESFQKKEIACEGTLTDQGEIKAAEPGPGKLVAQGEVNIGLLNEEEKQYLGSKEAIKYRKIEFFGKAASIIESFLSELNLNADSKADIRCKGVSCVTYVNLDGSASLIY